MKIAKKINKIIITLMVSVFMIFNISTINAASSISISVDDVYYTDEAVNVTINFSHDNSTMWHIVVSSPNLNVGGLSAAGGEMQTGKSGSISDGLGKLAAGSYTISANTGMSHDMSVDKPVEASTSRSFVVKERPVATPTPTPSTPNKPVEAPSEQPVEKTQAQIDAEKKAAEERKEEEERKAKEELAKEPLISSFAVISQSDKMFEKMVQTIDPKKEVLKYDYTLPINIQDFKLEVQVPSDDVQITFEDKVYSLETNNNSVEIPIKASKGDITQEYTFTVNLDKTPIVVRDVEGAAMTVFNDPTYDEFMVSKGFEKTSFEIDGVESFFYSKDKVKLQLLHDEKYDSFWYLLDENNELQEKIVVFQIGDDLFFVKDAPEDLQKETLNGEKYSEVVINADNAFPEFHPNMAVDITYNAWSTEDGEIVYGFKSNGEEGLFYKHVTGEDVISIEKAFVGFDNVDQNQKMISWGLGGVLFSLVGSGSIYAVSKKKNGKKEDEEDFIGSEETSE